MVSVPGVLERWRPSGATPAGSAGGHTPAPIFRKLGPISVPGHEGSLSTSHANSPDDALRRLETMVLMADVGLPLAAVRTQVEAALDLVVQVARRPDGSRRVVGVAEVVERSTWSLDDGPEPPRTRPVVVGDGVIALPERPPRAPACPPPDPAWIQTMTRRGAAPPGPDRRP